ncbi:peptide-transporting ATPase [Enterococcus gallinarum]|nr:peptide-transporting ATPase [Enterococcus gallinarum]
MRQNEQKDCGAAAFATLANLCGRKMSLAEARDLTRSNSTGATLQGLIEAGSKIGLTAEGLEGSIGELRDGIRSKEINLPFIALVVLETGLSHFLVVEEWSDTKIKVFDPAQGVKKISVGYFEKIWGGYIVIFRKTELFSPGQTTSISYYGTLFFKEKSRLLLVLLFSVVIALFSFLGSFSYQRIIDSFILNSESAIHEEHAHTSIFEEAFHEILYNFQYLILAVVILYLFQAILSIVRAFFIANVSKRMNDDLFEAFFKKILFMKATNLRARDSGELITRYNITTQVQQVLTRLVLSIFLEIFVAITGGAILYIINKQLFLVTTGILLGYTAVSIIFIKPLNKINNELIEKNARTLNVLNETFTGFETIKLFQRESFFLGKFLKQAKSFTHTGKYSVILQNSQASFILLLESLGTILVLWQGSTLVVADKLSLGALIAFISLITFYTSPVRNIIEYQREIQNVLVMVRKLSDVMDDVSEENEGENEVLNDTLKKEWRSIEFKNIYFSYAADNYIINNLSVRFKAGMSYALVGKSGSGKTTFMHLLSSLYSPDKGTILLNDEEIHENKKNYRKQIAYASNDPFLMFGTIRENLTLGMEVNDEGYLTEVLEAVGVTEMTNSFANGLDTVVLENGENLSSGQKQRIAIARALLKKPKILLLDEAFSNLDTNSKLGILKFIEDKLKSCIRIYVSHDDLVSSKVDEIIRFGS